MRNILVVGGSGFVGSAIVRRLAAKGARVVVPTRRRERAKHLIVLPTVDVVEADVHEPGTLAGLVARADAVVNLVGILHGDRGTPFGSAFRRAHVDLPAAIVAACQTAGVRRLLHMSALGADAAGSSMYLRSKAAGEAAVRSGGNALDWTIFRPSVIFGRDDSFLNLFAAMQRVAPFIPLGGAHARLQPVHVEDVARAFVNSLDAPATFGQAYDLAGPRVYTLGELVRFAGRAAGCPRAVMALPDPLARLQAFCMEFAPVKLLSRDNLDSLKTDSVTTSGFAPELGVVPAAMEAVMTRHLAHETPRERYMRLRDRSGR